jgi:hypothetical protein
MSGSSHLNIDITANSTAAAARIKELEEQIKLLRANITAIGTDSSRMGQQLVLSMQQGIAAAQATISALKGETAAINEVTGIRAPRHRCGQCC